MMKAFAPATTSAGSAATSFNANSTTIVSQSHRSFSTMDDMETGTKMYMSLYPEGSTDGALRLGNM
jgi:hypothetical protein